MQKQKRNTSLPERRQNETTQRKTKQRKAHKNNKNTGTQQQMRTKTKKC